MPLTAHRQSEVSETVRLAFRMRVRIVAWLVGVEFHAPLDTIEVISEAVLTANHLTDTDKQNNTGKYR